MNKKYYLGIDIGGTNTVFGVVDEKGKIIFHETFSTELYKDPKALVSDIYYAYRALNAEKNIDVRGVGIGAPNGNFYNGCIEFAPNLTWGEHVPIAQYFSNIFKLPVKLTNDANAAAIGEKVFGGAKEMNDFVVLTLGTGLGSGIFVNGKIVHGKNGFAGEFGHTKIPTCQRKCNCGNMGCLETCVSSRGIKQTYEELVVANSGKNILSEITTLHIYQMAVQGDAIAIAAFEKTARVLGESLANLVMTLDPEAIFLFGGIANAHPLLIPLAEQVINENVLPVFKGKVKIIPSSLLNQNAAVLGSAALFYL
jgi:glucokinase